jgi:peptidoglycan/xylan/chitin deacetylase (PgdA/CDA1 family)
VVGRGSTDPPPRVALTFDDGPHPTATPAVLDILAAHRVPAAFFVIGRNVAAHPDAVHRAHAEGHLIGNHTMDHRRWGAWRGSGYWKRELERANHVIAEATGREPSMFRPPMGLKTPHITGACRRLGLTMVTWSRRGLDGWPTTPEAILRRLAPRARAGDILALHDGAEPGRHRDAGPTIESLPRLIDAIRARGLEFERLDRLLSCAHIRR